jgi:cation diffusion facilitator CzcD-associated flavoprotein CzcO
MRRNFSVVNDVKRVAVVGGGVAGMQVVDRMKGLGLEVTMFEQKPDVGGVWRHNYAEFGL